MKKFSFIILVFVCLNANCQVADSTLEIIDYIETSPTFPGGDDSLWCFIENNLKLEILNSTTIHARYFVKFIIDTSGYPSNIEFIATRPSFENHLTEDNLIKSEIQRLFKFKPKWNPALLRNVKVPCGYIMAFSVPYIDFKCQYLKDRDTSKKTK
jgi:hypothetical protein